MNSNAYMGTCGVQQTNNVLNTPKAANPPLSNQDIGVVKLTSLDYDFLH